MPEPKDGKLEEGKTPDEMTAQELESLIKTPPKPEEKAPEVKTAEPKKEEALILGKFKTNDDVYKAYQEAEKKISQQGELNKKQRDFLSQIYELDAEGNPVGLKPQLVQQQPQPTFQPDPLAELRQYFPNLDDNTLGAVVTISGVMTKRALAEYHKAQEENLKPIREIVFERKVERQKKDCRESHQDFGIFEPDINAQLDKLPPELRGKDGAVESVYYMVKGQKADELVQKAKGETQTQVAEIEKKAEEAATIESGGKAAVPAPSVDTESMSAAELEKYIKKLGKKK